jgi:hypothetical protein
MTLIEIATAELIKKGMPVSNAKSFATELLIGFPLMVAEKYAMQKWKEGAAAQRVICKDTPLLSKCVSLEITQAIRVEVGNAKEPEYRC